MDAETNGPIPRGKIDGAKTLLLLAFLVVAAIEMAWLRGINGLENRVLDNFTRHHASTLTPDPEIVIVDIDTDSLRRMQDEVGSWPWPRSVHGELVRGMQRQRPKAIVFDILFNERDAYRPEHDRMFNDALAGNTNVFFPLVHNGRESPASGLHVAVLAGPLGLLRTGHADPNARINILLPTVIDRAFWRTGTINFREDSDGVGRRYDLYTDAYGWLIPSLPARVATDLGYTVPRQSDMLLSWRGTAKSYHQIPYADLYQDFSRQTPLRARDELTGKIVIIGTAAIGMEDLRSTPIASQYPGVQILATAVDNLKNQRAMRSPPAWVVPLAACMMLACVFGAFLYGANVLLVGAALGALSLLLLALTYSAITRLWLLPLIVPLMLAWAYYFAGALHAYLTERKSRHEAIKQFSRFVNPHVVQQLLTHGIVLGAGDSRQISVLFSDIRGFTALSENRTPQEIVALLNRYFTLQVEVVFRHGGSLDKFIGDCIMAFWGAPLDDPHHARNAVLAALEMAEVLRRFKAELGAGDLDFDVGIGIHSGPAVVGLIGSDKRREYTAIGDTVNLASRIESLTKGVSRILVSEETRQQCGDAFSFKSFGSFEVKGRGQDVNLFAPEKKGAGK
ncbi:adenylate/guanylate cyclase domain-containing protein [Massilia glaciei]|uniref:Adenylate/guanylate cyclase domain-containing protein n=1 Tax=Massilia glaciei TaxID=1524097 RepID=A0A2U2I7A4_9BURK|nr:adenylate/guanylate cyclase domain-containing protein [Massilia glaciei]PWF55621.1 adenylate/guanylate cyclase domain-containing protein [Massilia glaciei]